jgi:integrase
MRREAPIKRRNPSGSVVWVARYTGRDGKHHIAKPTWNRGKGTFDRKADGQRAIDEAYGLSDRPDTLGAYFSTWTDRHPRSERTNATNEHRIGRLVDVEVEGIALKDWPLRELRRRHALVLVDHMLRTEGRATTGAVGILRSLSAMAEDAITDEVCDLNPFKGIPIRASDPRAQKKRRPIRVFSFEEMHRFAKAAGRYEALVRTFTDTGMRLGEVLPLRPEDFDGETLQVRRTAHEGVVFEGTKTDHGEEDAGRVVPVPATLAWMLEAQINLNGSGCELLFSTPSGRMWRERNFYRDVWKLAQEASGLNIRPHECRHSYVTLLHGAGIHDADLAQIAGHRIETMLARYTHALGQSFGPVRSAIDGRAVEQKAAADKSSALGKRPAKP